MKKILSSSRMKEAMPLSTVKDGKKRQVVFEQGKEIELSDNDFEFLSETHAGFQHYLKTDVFKVLESVGDQAKDEKPKNDNSEKIAKIQLDADVNKQKIQDNADKKKSRKNANHEALQSKADESKSRVQSDADKKIAKLG